MAKRRRLDPHPGPDLAASLAANLAPEMPADLETKSLGHRYPLGVAPTYSAPIAAIVADSAVQSALAAVSAELTGARAEGRLLLRLPLAAVDADYLVRDRIAADPDETAALTASIRARGQQAPIEVADLGGGRYGLISGWRRLVVLRDLAAQGGADAPATVLAILRRPEAAAGAYLAMVEENEIRAGLGFYERARIVVRATDQGVFADDRAALWHLFAAAPRARRSKIGSFVRLVRLLEGAGCALRFPAEMSEKQGLALLAALEGDPGLAGRIAAAVLADPPASAQAEAALLAALLRPARQGAAAPAPVAVAPGLTLQFGAAQAVIRGAALDDPAFRAALQDWLGQAWENSV